MSGGAGDGVDLGAVDLAEVEAAVADALAAGDDAGLTVLGYGEISLVVGWPAEAPRWACKRLPPMADPLDVDRYEAAFDRYLALLADRGAPPVPTAFRRTVAADGRTVPYVVQPVLDPATLGPEVLRSAEPSPEHPLLVGIADAAVAVCDATTGLDGQVSNWTWSEEAGLGYLDVSTPFLFHLDGALVLDVDTFLRAYPAPLRPVIGRFVAPSVLGAYRDPRHVLVDLAGNLLKERLGDWVPVAVAVANERLVDAQPITEDEVAAYYRSDARLWETMLGLRRADRWWQRTMRRRPYPFLLPGPIER